MELGARQAQGHPPVKGPASPEASPSEAEKEEESTKRVETVWKLLNLLYCVVSLNAAMLLWGISQEYVMTNDYSTKPGVVSKIPSSLFVVLCNRIASALFTGWVVRVHGQGLWVPGHMLAAKAAVSNGVSSWSQYKSLDYISFTLQTTTKSAKMLPVLLMSSWRGKSHTPVDYAETLVIVCALVVFGLETDGREGGGSTVWIGILLLCVLLFFDSCTPHLQDELFATHPEVTAVQATFAMSSVAAVGMFVILVLSGTIFECLRFISEHPDVMLHLFVLSLASTLTQYFISYTVKNFGPTVFTLIASTRQVIAVCISAALFRHEISPLASVAVALTFSMVIVRALRSFLMTKLEKAGRSRLRLLRFAPLLLCAIAIHVLHFSYGVAQEFLSVHSFGGQLFSFPQAKVSVNHCTAALVSFASLRARGLPVIGEGKSMRWTLLAGAAILGATTCQHMALSFISFETQTLMKTLKVVPVMLVGVLLGNRRYSAIDYIEGALITALAVFFVSDSDSEVDSHIGGERSIVLGILLMLGYVGLDSFTSNLQDYIYQKFSMDPAQVLFGMEAVSATGAILSFLVLGRPGAALAFLCRRHQVILHLSFLALSAAFGAYACAITVRLFGPAVFTLLMVSRQSLSQVVSVWFFHHPASSVHMLCLVAVAMVMLTSSLRRVSTQLAIGSPPSSPKSAGSP
ncbi:unnamed protein product [Prorocentrum cordatum]|uniref:Uncharacterized protein n=1 Tax=Prorocentrum cordatum TaxID=2364126 RepID=A0ABN9SJ27_9DINO|nr:unnamed protein product [Polarella glacialis]